MPKRLQGPRSLVDVWGPFRERFGISKSGEDVCVVRITNRLVAPGKKRHGAMLGVDRGGRQESTLLPRNARKC